MPRKIESKLDDFGFDTELDNFDFDFNPKPIKDDRSPVTKVVTGIAKGVRATFKDEAFLSKAIKNLFPRGYGSAFDTLVDTKNSLKDLYHSASEITAPALNDAKRVTSKYLPQGAKYLPDSLTKQLERFSANIEKESSQYTYQSHDESAISETLAQLATLQAQADEAKEVKQEAKDRLKEGIDFSKHKESIGQLNAMRVSLSQLVTYQNKITSTYQRKSLELQYRQYFIARDALAEQKRFNAESKVYFEAISKNTSLPDYVKLKGTERFGEALRNRFINNALSGLFGHRDSFIKGIGARVNRNLRESLGNTVNQFRMGLSGLQTTVDMAQGFSQMDGAGINPRDMALDAGGQFLGAGLTNSLFNSYRMGRASQAFFAKHFPGMTRRGNELQYLTQNLPQRLTEFSRNYNGRFAGLISPFTNAVMQGRMNRNIDVDNIHNLQEPGIYTRQTNKSINEVIPGYLARIHQELKIIRTGDVKTEALGYDYTKNRFDSESSVKNNLIKSVLNPLQRQTVSGEVDSLIDQIDPNKTLSATARRALGTQLLHDNISDREFSPRRLSSQSTYRGEAAKYGSQYAALFKSYFDNDPDSSRKVNFSGRANDLGRFIGLNKGNFQNIVNAGQGQILADAGLLSMGGIDPNSPAGLLNLEKYFSYFYGDEFKAARTTATGDHRLHTGPGFRSVGRDDASMPQSHFGEAGPSVGSSLSAVIRAIESINPISLLTLANSTLSSIDAKLSTGVVSVNAGTINMAELEKTVAASRGKVREHQSILRRTLSEATHLGFSGAKLIGRGLMAGRDLFDSTAGRVLKVLPHIAASAITHGARLVGGAYRLARGPLELYRKGDLKPILSQKKLEAGEYIDGLTGRALKRFEDIKGPVLDKTGKVLLDLDEVKGGLFTKNRWGVLKPFKTLISLSTAGVNTVLGGVRTGIGRAMRGLGRGVNWYFGRGSNQETLSPEERAQAGQAPGQGGNSSRRSPNDRVMSGLFHAGKFGLNLFGRAGRFVSQGLGEGIANFSKILSFAIEPIFRGRKIVSVLTQIKNILDARLPGRKIRKGSYEDQQNQKKEEEKEELEKENALGMGSLRDTFKSSIYGMGAGALSHLFGRGKKKDEEKEGDGSDGVIDTALGTTAGVAAGGVLSRTWQGAKRLGRGLFKGGKGGGFLPKVGGALSLLGAGDAVYDMTQNGVNLSNSTQLAGSVLLSSAGRAAAVSAISTGAAALGSAILTFGALPVIAAGALVAGAGIGAYALYNLITRKDPQPLSTLRMIQYGFRTDDVDRFRKLLKFEALMSDIVSYTEFGANISADKVKSKADDIADIFGISLNNSKDVTKFGFWFDRRFKPVYLTWMMQLKKVNKEVGLVDIDDKLKPEEKEHLLSGLQIDESLYSVMISPFPTDESLQTTASDVAQATSVAKESIAQEAKSTPAQKEEKAVDALSGGSLALAAQAGTLSQMKTNDQGPSQIAVAAQNRPGIPLAAGSIMVKGASGLTAGTALTYDEHDYIFRVRMLEYGFDPNNKSICDKLIAYEKIAEKNVRDVNGHLELLISNVNTLRDIAGLFGVGSLRDINNIGTHFGYWNHKRFTVVLFKYLKALKSLKINAKMAELDRTLTNDQKAALLEHIRTEKAPYDVTDSPVSGAPLQTSDVMVQSIIDEALKFYKNKGAKPAQATAADAEDANKKPEEKGFFGSMVDKVKNFFGFGDKDKAASKPTVPAAIPRRVPGAPNAASATLNGSAAAMAASSAVANGTSLIDQYLNNKDKMGPILSGGVRVVKGDGVKNRKLMIRVAKENGITDPTELAMFLAQMDHESAGFTTLSENLHYSANNLLKTFPKYFRTPEEAQKAAAAGPQAIATIAYGNRMGNNGLGEGWTYRGRGFIQLTGKSNYIDASRDLGIDIVNNPDLASSPEVAAKLAVWYWKKHKVGIPARQGDVKEATFRINAGYNGLAERTSLFSKYINMVRDGKIDAEANDTSGDSKVAQAQDGSLSSTDALNQQTPGSSDTVSSNASSVGAPQLGSSYAAGAKNVADANTQAQSTGAASSASSAITPTVAPLANADNSPANNNSLYTGFSPKSISNVSDASAQQQSNAQSALGGSPALSDAMKENVAVSRQILNVNSQQLDALVQIVKALSTQSLPVRVEPNNKSNPSDVSANAPVSMKKKFAS